MIVEQEQCKSSELQGLPKYCEWDSSISKCVEKTKGCEDIFTEGDCNGTAITGKKCFWVDSEVDNYKCQEVKDACNKITREITCNTRGVVEPSTNYIVGCVWIEGEEEGQRCQEVRVNCYTNVPARPATCNYYGIVATWDGSNNEWIDKQRCLLLYKNGDENNPYCRPISGADIACDTDVIESICNNDYLEGTGLDGQCNWYDSGCKQKCSLISADSTCNGRANECFWLYSELEGNDGVCKEMMSDDNVICSNAMRNSQCENTSLPQFSDVCYWLYSSSILTDNSGSCESQTDNSISCSSVKRSEQCENDSQSTFGSRCLWASGDGTNEAMCVEDVCLKKVVYFTFLYFILFYFILLYFISFYFILLCFIMFYFIL
jgi:hypothetical protein